MIPRMERQDKRLVDQLRPISFETGIAPNATASVLVTFGRTKVICAVTIEEDVPRWMKVQRVEGGWLTAEYSMLPYSTLDRKRRDITAGGEGGWRGGPPRRRRRILQAGFFFIIHKNGLLTCGEKLQLEEDFDILCI